MTETTDTPDSNTDAISVSVNGLLQSRTPSTPQLATAFAYDSLGQLTSTTDPRMGTTTNAYSSTTGQQISSSDGTQTITYEYYPATHPNAGQLKSKTNGNGKITYFKYSARGELIQTWGDETYPVEYTYNEYGQQAEMRTYRGGLGWQSSTWPTQTTGTADITQWTYHNTTGLLTQKQDSATMAVNYTYDALGRIKTRSWARLSGGSALVSTYSYSANTGELSGISYSDSTPAVTFGYDRDGRSNSISDASGARSITYNAVGQTQTEQITGGILDGAQVSVGYDAFLRRNSLQASKIGSTLLSQTYTYDGSSRLATITSGAQTATYSYYANTGSLNTTNFTGGTSIGRSYDSFGRVQSITTTPSSGSAASYTYTYDNLNQRTRVTREDNSYWSFGYNDRSEVVSGKRYWSDNVAVAGQQFEYAFDNIGNRSISKSGGNAQGSGLRQANHTSNSLNQYSQRSVPAAVDVIGTADSAAIVTVNNQSSYRKAGYFHKELALDNSAGPVFTQVNVVGVKNNAGPAGEDIVAQQSGNIYLPQANEAFTYDADGNLTSDGRWNYTWDGENRLISMQAIAGVPAAAKRRQEFTYDFAGRRVQKLVFAWNSGTSSYQLQSTTKFIYEGRNLVAELDGSNALVRSYVWGQDASETFQGVGGIGGLLLINGSGNSYIAGYDGNGNVTALVKASTGAVAATYEYAPFGNTLASTGEFSASNPFKFSTRYSDVETGLIYYGYRYYNAQTGRWISRDPDEEKDGANLYSYVLNSPTNFIDPTGRQRDRTYRGGKHHDLSSPNWDFATGQMEHTFHSLVLCIPKMDLKVALGKIYNDLVQFAHFEPNTARLTKQGSKAHFQLEDSGLRFLSAVAGNSIDVELYLRPEQKEMFGVTLGNHPLVGIRR